jgi:predicted ATP-dependent serine protease
LFGTKSNPELGFNDKFYLQRDYLDKELRTSILFNQNILLTGGPGSGKSRTILELIKKYLTKYSIILPIIDMKEALGFEKLDSFDKTVVIYDDINLFFTQNWKSHLEAISQIVFKNKISIIATCRNTEIEHVKRVLERHYKLFKKIEIKQLNLEDNKALAKVITTKSAQKNIDHIGDYFE